MDDKPPSVQQLRDAWQPTKDRLASNERYQPILIRIHRALSWLDRAESLAEGDLDQKLILQWIALNSLYGRWDRSRREPEQDVTSLEAFVRRVVGMDKGGRVRDLLVEWRPAVLAILEDPYLVNHFWQDPTEARATQAGSVRHKAVGWYAEGRFTLILEHLLHRIRLLRCQLVHGAATCGGTLNRSALRSCADMLGRLVPVFLLVVMEHGAKEDWGPLCYPPLRKTHGPIH